VQWLQVTVHKCQQADGMLRSQSTTTTGSHQSGLSRQAESAASQCAGALQCTSQKQGCQSLLVLVYLHFTSLQTRRGTGWGQHCSQAHDNSSLCRARRKVGMLLSTGCSLVVVILKGCSLCSHGEVKHRMSRTGTWLGSVQLLLYSFC
jgi:hypothetical protein